MSRMIQQSITGILFVCLAGTCLVAAAQEKSASSQPQSIQLFNGKSLDGLYTFIKGRGKNQDPLKVFTVQDGMLHITGEEWGCVTSDQEFENYRLTVEFKWGERTNPPRVEKARDSGVLLHSVGEDGAFGDTWMHSIECQLIEGGTGDFIVVGDGTDAFSITSPVAPEKSGDCYVFQPGGKQVDVHSGRVNWFGRDPEWKDVKGFRGKQDVEKTIGEWNVYELTAEGSSIAVKLNGVLVNQCTNVKPNKGRIQIQSEGAELFVRKVELTPLPKHPENK